MLSWTATSRSLNASSGPPPASAAKVALGPVHVLARGRRRGAPRRRRVPSGEAAARLDRVQHLRRAAAVLLDPVGVAVEDLEHRQGPRSSGSSRAMWKAGARAIMVWKPT